MAKQIRRGDIVRYYNGSYKLYIVARTKKGEATLIPLADDHEFAPVAELVKTEIGFKKEVV